MLLGGNVANADTIRANAIGQAITLPISIVVPLPMNLSPESADPQVAPATLPEVNPTYTFMASDSDTVGDAAIAKFKCDCSPCRAAIVEMLQAGRMAL